ncbi:MAG TPA: hypothetical protein VFA81_03120 [Burkholderiales bacterium]|nr:hypothetical protein [Burkholderiales bacterium]
MRAPLFALLLVILATSVSAAEDASGWIKDKKGCKIANPNPKPKETAQWSGACLQGYAHGKGVLQFYSDGKPSVRYEGELSQGVLSGRGELRMADGSIYDGDWVDGKPEGYGKFTSTDGSTYVGGWTAGKQDGPGTLTDKNGKRVTGTWRAGQYVGNQ